MSLEAQRCFNVARETCVCNGLWRLGARSTHHGRLWATRHIGLCSAAPRHAPTRVCRTPSVTNYPRRLPIPITLAASFNPFYPECAVLRSRIGRVETPAHSG